MKIKAINPAITGTDLGTAGRLKRILVLKSKSVLKAVAKLRSSTSSREAFRYLPA
jgi:hypothetical protein